MDTNIHYDARKTFKRLRVAITDGDIATIAACDSKLKETNDLYFEELFLSEEERELVEKTRISSSNKKFLS